MELFVELFFGYLAHKNTSSVNYISCSPLHPRVPAQCLLSEVVMSKGALPQLHTVQNTKADQGRAPLPHV